MSGTIADRPPRPLPPRLLRGIAIAVGTLLWLVPGAAAAQDPPYDRGIDRACSAEARGFDPFPDTSASAHYEATNCIAYHGVTRGTLRDGVPHFLPSAEVTRAQMASFVARVLDAIEPYDLPQDPDPAFSDVDGGPHAERIDQLAALGIVEGIGDGTYRPERNVPRGQMASYIARSIEAVTEDPLPEADVFDDVPPPHDVNVRKLAGAGIVQGVGDGTYRPDRAVTRAQMTTFLARTMDHLVSQGYEVVATTPAFPQPVSSFTTPLQPGQPRNHNIHLAADIIDGDVIEPGDTYSLDEAIGQRTAERGFQENGFIDDGEVISVVGGGVSQVATTFFNAAWFAGIELVEHQPHSQYFERYPPGREATIAWQRIDVVVRNDTPFPLEVATRHSETEVVVTLIGTPWFDVTDTWDDAPTGATTGDAFSVNYGRTVAAPDGSTSQDAFSWTYEAG